MSDNDVASYAEQYGLTLEKASTVERNGKTYYLSKIAETDEDGKLRFDKLKYEDYVIKELKAPKGFYIIPHQSVQDCDLTAVESIETTIQNRKAAIMPATGGQGSGGIIALGALLAIIGAEVFVMLLRRRAIARNM
jgi:LPXTG-motif cell wall-anchored protein